MRQDFTFAASMALSNMGHGLPELEKMISAFSKRNDNATLQEAVDHFCMHLYEGERYQNIFTTEARGWLKLYRGSTEAKLREIYPDFFQLWGKAKSYDPPSGAVQGAGGR